MQANVGDTEQSCGFQIPPEAAVGVHFFKDIMCLYIVLLLLLKAAQINYLLTLD